MSRHNKVQRGQKRQSLLVSSLQEQGNLYQMPLTTTLLSFTVTGKNKSRAALASGSQKTESETKGVCWYFTGKCNPRNQDSRIRILGRRVEEQSREADSNKAMISSWPGLKVFDCSNLRDCWEATWNIPQDGISGGILGKASIHGFHPTLVKGSSKEC